MKTCTRCVMNDRADETIRFDAQGQCSYCTDALRDLSAMPFARPDAKTKLDALIAKIKEEGKGKQYDCLMGISGGLDSSYLAYLGHKWGLRILAVHIDDGFDTDISKSNIQKLVDAAGIRLHIIRPDAEAFNDLTLSYMKAGVPNLTVPQDNVLFAFLYDFARRENIRYFLSGGNFALECILQQGNTHSATDTRNIRAIHRRFGKKSIKPLKFISSYRKYWDQKVLGLQTLRPLNYIDYDRDRAFDELKAFCGFEYYGAKHLENILTAFVQLYWLPQKFHVDKRTSHLSSMIVSGQMTRQAALAELAKAPIAPDTLSAYLDIIKEKLGIDGPTFDAIMAAPTHRHDDYAVERFAPIIRRLFFSGAK